jgi:hypothetical protein
MMLILLELVLSAAIAAAGTALLVLVLNRHAPGPLSGALFLFLLLLLGTWAVGTWVRPVGPMLGGVPWLAFMIIGLALAVFIAAVSVPWAPPPEEPPREDHVPGAAVTMTLGLFFYFAMFVLLAAIALRHLGPVMTRTP